MKLHNVWLPFRYKFAPSWLIEFTCEVIENMRSHDAMEFWLWEGTPYPCGSPMLYQVIEGLTWSLRIGSISTIDDEIKVKK